MLYDKNHPDMQPTLENYEKQKAATLELMGNPFCDHIMFMSLSDKLKKIESKIEELKNENTSSNNSN